MTALCPKCKTPLVVMWIVDHAGVEGYCPECGYGVQVLEPEQSDA